jgi:hypothetical protein
MAPVTQMLRRARSERGAELVEMAMATPILLLITAAIFDFGFMFRAWEVVTNAAREGARVGVLPAYSCDAPGAGVVSDVEERVKAYMDAAGITDEASYLVEMGTTAIAAGGSTFTACQVKVTLTQDLPSLSVIGQLFGGQFGAVPLAALAVMRTETQSEPGP